MEKEESAVMIAAAKSYTEMEKFIDDFKM